MSHDIFNSRSGTVIIVAITSKPQRAGFPLTLSLPDSCGLPKSSWVKISQVRTLDVDRIGRLLGRANEDVLSEVFEGLRELMGH